MSVHTRRRLALAVGVLAALLVIAFVAVPALPCQFPGGDVCPPSDDAIHLVPDDALAYVHVNVNPDTEQYKVARDVAARVPNLAGQVDRPSAAGPGSGAERLAAELPTGHRPVVRRAGGAGRGARRREGRGGGTAASGLRRERGEQVRRLGGGRTAQDLGLPQRPGERRPAWARHGDRRRVPRDRARQRRAGRDRRPAAAPRAPARWRTTRRPARRATLSRPSAWPMHICPRTESQSSSANPRGPLATLDAAVDPTASDGVAMALVADDQGINVDIRSELERVEGQGPARVLRRVPGVRAHADRLAARRIARLRRVRRPRDTRWSHCLRRPARTSRGWPRASPPRTARRSSSARSTSRRSCCRRSATRLPLPLQPAASGQRHPLPGVPQQRLDAAAGRTERSRASRARSPTRSTPRQARRRASARAR